MPSNFSHPLNSTTTPPHGGGTNSTAAAAAAKKAMQIKMAIAQANDQTAAKWFAVAMAGLILLFTVFHWSRFLYSRYASKRSRESEITNAIVTLARYTFPFCLIVGLTGIADPFVTNLHMEYQASLPTAI
jgi:hypothetical protein